MIVITGASDGLGLALAQLYKKQGKKVVNISRRSSSAADVNILHDLTKGSEIETAATEVKELGENIEAIVNCIGVWGEEAIGHMTEAETDLILSTNIKAPLLFISSLIDTIKCDGTDVVNVISTAGINSNKDHMAYVASKWGERGFTSALRSELRDTRSRVISFFPGGMKTKFFEKNLGSDITEDDSYWMNVDDVAVCIKQILDLPKGIEVSEITLNRKKAAK